MTDPLVAVAKALEEHNHELIARMTHQAGHLVNLLEEIDKLKRDIGWWKGVCKTKDEQILALTEDVRWRSEVMGDL